MSSSTTEAAGPDSSTTNTEDSGAMPALNLTAADESSCGCCAAPASAAPAVPASATFDVQGLTCGSCVNKVEKIVAALDGVESASVALVAGGTSVLSISGSASPEVIAAAVTDAGYPAAVSA